MTRADVKELLVSFGITDPTDEQITALLNKHQADVQREKATAEKYKQDALKVTELQQQLEELNNKGLDEVALMKKEIEKATADNASLTKELANMRLTAELAKIGIVDDDAKNLFNEDGSLNVSNLGTIITARETSAKSALEQELLKKTPDPNGGNGGNDDNGNDEYLKSVIAMQVGNSDKSSDILNSYTS